VERDGPPVRGIRRAHHDLDLDLFVARHDQRSVHSQIGDLTTAKLGTGPDHDLRQ
jgi:hypothetical protein